VHLFCSEFAVAAPRDTFAHRVPVLPLGRTLRLWSFALFAPGIVKRQNCDVTVGFGRLLSQDVLRSGGGTHRGFLQRMGEQGGPLRKLWQRLSPYHQSLLRIERWQFADPALKRVIAVSDEVQRDIATNYRIGRDKIQVLYNGVDQERFHPARRQSVRDEMRARWDIPQQAPLVLFVGSGFARKGLDRLINLWQRPGLRQVYLMIAGDDSRIAYYKNWAGAVAADRIRFVGRQEAIENFYASADVVALPALQEAFGNVVLEALASGLPVLLSREVGAGALLTGGLRQGIVDNAADPEQLEGVLLTLLDQSVSPVVRSAARQLGETYSWSSHFQRLEGLLGEIVTASSASRVS
jgi:UDP-glucose:(heptosyl)LPS alpha-1,3-glucosyltransferase